MVPGRLLSGWAGESSEQPEAGRLLNLSEPQFPDLKGEVPTLAFVSD